MTFFKQTLGAALVVLCVTTAAFASPQADKVAPAAEQAAAPTAAEQKVTAEQEAAAQAFLAAAVPGPAEAKLGDVATLKIPQDMVFIPAAQASAMLAQMGNHVGDSIMGMVLPKDDKSGWLVVAEYDDSGFIKDADGDKFNADEILEQMKEGISVQNEERAKRGYPAMEIVGWIQNPTYDKTKRQLVWSISARDITPDGKPLGDANENSVNYNTFTLGRAGFISLNLVSSQGTIEKDKHVAGELLAGLNFVQGRRYEDFDAKTDKVAEYGLMALIGGVALKKAGLFAGLAVLFAKFAKIIVVVVLGAAVAVKKFFTRNKAV